MESKILSIPNISCGHCVAAIKDELNEIEGVTHVDGDPDSKTISVKWDAPANLTKIKERLLEINYPASN